MIVTAQTNQGIAMPNAPILADVFLSCYEILNSDSFRWGVRLYKVRIESDRQSHAERGDAKQAIWSLKKKHPHACKGYGFVVDLDEETVAVPSGWQLPSDVRENNHLITFDSEFTTDPKNRGHRTLIGGILREAIKKHFKDNRSDILGDWWQDFDRFCQMPDYSGESFDYYFCRKFGASAKVLIGDRWVIQPLISTTSVDGRTFSDYFRDGDVASLTEMIEAKQANRINRRNRATAVRVLRDESTEFVTKAEVMELDEPNLLNGIASLSRLDQASRAEETIKCRVFGRDPVDVPLRQLRLILDTQITQADHSETILEPLDRHRLAEVLREFLNGAKVQGVPLQLAELPIDATTLPGEVVQFPALRVHGRGDSEQVVNAPSPATRESLRTRGRQRTDAIKRFGYLQGHPINPLLAWPKRFGQDRARKMCEDLNQLMQSAGIDYRFAWTLYDTAEELGKYIADKGFDSAMVVLPEGWKKPHRHDSMHERIKQRIDVPSQCIQHDHTLPEAWVRRPPNQQLSEQDRKLERRVRQRYELCLWNLLAKLNWIPFAPLDPFHYNVHIGLDVGGRHNNHAMACLGYGFATPREGLIFRPEEIAIDVQKAEPIPTECLKRGLLQLIEQIHSELTTLGVKPNWERLLFFRDGRLLGDGDEWNELDAIRSILALLRERGWVSENAVWTAVEVMKAAEEWRIMSGSDGVSNPMVGQCLFPFPDPSTGLICTSGSPYLPQGTACPLKISIIDIAGKADRREVAQDLIWEADMCFTKPDIGLSLPWVLHVSDVGALQAARSYRITGITV